MEKQYPGIGIVGYENISALYGVDNGIVDWKGTGIQHFFHKSFEQDLIHSATTYLHHESLEKIELGNRLISKDCHPVHQHPLKSTVEEGFCYTTSFQSQVLEHLTWTERVYATHQDQIVFETTISNGSSSNLSLSVGGYVILRNPLFKKVTNKDGILTWENNKTRLTILAEDTEETNVYKESPTGFVYRTYQKMFDHCKSDPLQEFTDETMVGVVSKKTITIPPNQERIVRWMVSASSVSEGITVGESLQTSWRNMLRNANEDWKEWLKGGSLHVEHFPEKIKNAIVTNIIALKASLLHGFVPADITGHYYSNGSPSYYVRDSLMIAKAFLMAGYYAEAKSIILYASTRQIKGESGEFYQRYNAIGEPSEGANNDVFHQFDSQGYFLSLIYRYFELTSEWIVSYNQVKSVANVLFQLERKRGLIGPEGGVNEGVFGPAFITSSNMFIVGGLLSASKIANHFNDDVHESRWRNLATSITEHIEEGTWIEEQKRYGYGYVLYDDELVRKYDTPQYFGPLYGYPITAKFKEMIDASLKNQSFFEYGIGYSEQEYHHGPWIFNTAANAQCQALVGNNENYVSIVHWMIEHSNAYGLLPEAIDGNSEDICFINPLTWACAEFISAVSIGKHLLTKPDLKLEVKG